MKKKVAPTLNKTPQVNDEIEPLNQSVIKADTQF